MKLIYNPKKEDFEEDKKPYDSVAIFEFLKSMGVKTVTTQRTDKLIIEVDKTLTTTQQTALKNHLMLYDITKTKVLSLEESE